MKKFYDREPEMNQLHEMQQQAFDDYSRFVVLTGRRRVGKTSLVYRLMEETKEQAPGLYFFVGRKTEAARESGDDATSPFSWSGGAERWAVDGRYVRGLDIKAPRVSDKTMEKGSLSVTDEYAVLKKALFYD